MKQISQRLETPAQTLRCLRILRQILVGEIEIGG